MSPTSWACGGDTSRQAASGRVEKTGRPAARPTPAGRRCKRRLRHLGDARCAELSTSVIRRCGTTKSGTGTPAMSSCRRAAWRITDRGPLLASAMERQQHRRGTTAPSTWSPHPPCDLRRGRPGSQSGQGRKRRLRLPRGTAHRRVRATCPVFETRHRDRPGHGGTALTGPPTLVAHPAPAPRPGRVGRQARSVRQGHRRGSPGTTRQSECRRRRLRVEATRSCHWSS